MRCLMTCEHNSFVSNVRINRLKGESVMRFHADISVHCCDCGIMFKWKVPRVGVDFTDATTSALGLELRVSLEPSSEEDTRIHHTVTERLKK